MPGLPRCCPGVNDVIQFDLIAYLDAGTGSMLVQLLVGGVAAISVAAKFYWRRVLRFLRIRKDEPEPTPVKSEG
jgi:hypothetical protein